MAKAQNYIETLQMKGISSFSTEEFASQTGISYIAAQAALHRLREKGQIATPYHKFHVIVPPSIRAFGCLPAEEFIDDLMKKLNTPYYVGLLSAAEYHGASHQSSQVFQVITKKRIADLECGRIRVKFLQKKNIEKIPISTRNVRTGYVKISTPESTAYDLIGYADVCAGLNHVATVLKELQEAFKPKNLVDTAKYFPTPWVQRLGYLLVLVGARDHAEVLLEYIAKKATRTTPLSPIKTMTGFPIDRHWKVAVNASVEADEI